MVCLGRMVCLGNFLWPNKVAGNHVVQSTLGLRKVV